MPSQSSRLDFQLRSEHTELIERAAAVRGQTVSQFAVSTLLEAARESIRQASVTELSTRDGGAFLAMLDANAEPNAAILQAAERHRGRTRRA